LIKHCADVMPCHSYIINHHSLFIPQSRSIFHIHRGAAQDVIESPCSYIYADHCRYLISIVSE
jgi:hypothetical protein